MENKKIFYRWKIAYWDSVNATHLYIEEQYVIKETEKSYILSTYMYSRKWDKRIWKTSVDSSRWYCATTEEIAMKQLYNRTLKRISWFKYYLTTCKEAIKLLDKMDLFKKD